MERFTLNGTTGAATFAGTITAPSYAIYGLGTILKADGSTDSTSYATLGIYWYSWYYCKI
jgi:hypothetical protein